MSHAPVSGQSHGWPALSQTHWRPLAPFPSRAAPGALRLEGRVALVAGGHGGIGRRVARAFAREGADVCIAYYDEHGEARRTLEQVVHAGRNGLAISGDLTDRSHCRRVMARLIARFDRIDILVNDAEPAPPSRELVHISDVHLEQALRTNLFSPLWLTQAALPHLRPGGVILNSGSLMADEGSADCLDYAVSKGAVHALTRSLARALSTRGIRVNCVAAGADCAPMRRADGGEADPLAEAYVMLACEEGSRYDGRIVEVRRDGIRT